VGLSSSKASWRARTASSVYFDSIIARDLNLRRGDHLDIDLPKKVDESISDLNGFLEPGMKHFNIKLKKVDPQLLAQPELPFQVPHASPRLRRGAGSDRGSGGELT
jgi:hypothetical protein